MINTQPNAVVGHSKGALASFAYLSQTSEPPPLYVNLSGRYDMKRANRTYTADPCSGACNGQGFDAARLHFIRNHGSALLSCIRKARLLRMEGKGRGPAYSSQGQYNRLYVRVG